MQFLKKHSKEIGFIVVILIITIARIFLSYNLPSFYINNLRYDDKLMINQLKSLKSGEYLGEYKDVTLVKGIAFPMFLYIAKSLNISYSFLLTILYVLASLFLIVSLRNIIKDKSLIMLIYMFLAFNPITFSSDIFQRLYRNSLSIIELLFFLGAFINIVSSEKKCIFSNILLGLIMAIMFLTRGDNIWTIVIYFCLIVYKLYKNFKFKNLCVALIPVLMIAIVLNTVSYINYKKYNIYTYNELSNSSFKKAYVKILQIKDDKKIEKTAITRSTFDKLIQNSEAFKMDKDYIDLRYDKLAGENGEIYNGNIVWYFRYWVYNYCHFKDGKEADMYFKELSEDIDRLFAEGKLEKEFVIPSVNINTPTISEFLKLPKNLCKAVVYTTTYKNIKSFNNKDLKEQFMFDEGFNAYKVTCRDYHNAENIIDNNRLGFEFLRNVYKYFTIVFSVIALIVYIKNIKTRDKLNFLNHAILLSYLIILSGVTYTDTTAFDAIRYCYLGNVYILQNLFILFSFIRIYDNREGSKNDISNSTSV